MYITNTKLKEQLDRIEAKLDVSIVVRGLASKEDIDSLQGEINEIKRIVQTK